MQIPKKSFSKDPRHRDDYGEGRYTHHDYNRGSMSDSEPHNEYNRHKSQDYGTESRQSYGRGYGADNSFTTGYNADEVYGRSPSDHSYAANPDPNVRGTYHNQKQWDQDNGTWKTTGDFYKSPKGQGTNVDSRKVPRADGP